MIRNYLFIPALFIFIGNSNGLLQRCFKCTSRGELGSCKDPFNIKVNGTQVALEKGIEAATCASGWCGKIVGTEDEYKEEYGVATQRMCMQRGPSDGEDRCAYTKWKYRMVLMCFCRGDLCNSARNIGVDFMAIGTLCAMIFYIVFCDFLNSR